MTMADSTKYLKYLDERTAQMSAEFVVRHAACEKVIQQAFEHLAWTITHVAIHEHRRQITAAALTSRILQQTHAAHVLLRGGNLSSAAVILRSLLESVFAVAALARDSNFEDGRDFFMRLRFKTAHADRQALRKFLSAATSLSDEQRSVLVEKQADLEKWMAEHKQHATKTVREVAEAAEMIDFYEKEYAWQSKPTHSDIEDVVNKHVAMKDGKVTLVAAVITHDEVPALTAQLVTMLMDTAVAVATLFGLKFPKEELERQSEVARAVGRLFENAAAI